jgi:ribonuclease J
MRCIIHRGTHEIGGSCVEIFNDQGSILIDIGLPLWIGRDQNQKTHDRTVRQLINEGILPDIPGLYIGDDRACSIKGVIISHAHQDHYGLLQFVKSGIDVYTGKAGADLMRLTAFFSKQKHDENRQFHPVQSSVSFIVAGFTITPYLNDHSAFDAYSFLIEADSRKLFYSGDFRDHGRKHKAFEWLLKNGPENVDLLLMEGTMISRDSTDTITEDQVQQEIETVARKYKGLVFAYSSSQNIDRIVSLYKAAIVTGRLLAVDMYTAHILKTIAGKTRIPYPSPAFAHMKVFYPYGISRMIADQGSKEMLYEFKPYKISLAEISGNPGRHIMMVRPSMIREIGRIGNLANACLIYSIWEG